MGKKNILLEGPPIEQHIFFSNVGANSLFDNEIKIQETPKSF